jgi:hypothetical protein
MSKTGEKEKKKNTSKPFCPVPAASADLAQRKPCPGQLGGSHEMMRAAGQITCGVDRREDDWRGRVEGRMGWVSMLKKAAAAVVFGAWPSRVGMTGEE